jgi:hypothetical protein
MQKSGGGIPGRFGNHQKVPTNKRGNPFFPTWIYHSFEVSQVYLTAATVHAAGPLIQLGFGTNTKHPIKHVTDCAAHKFHAREQVLRRETRNEVSFIDLDEFGQKAWRGVYKLKKLPTLDGIMTPHGTLFTSSVLKKQRFCLQ